MTASELYERDFYEWTRRNAELIRRGRLAEADAEHVAQEIEDMGKRERCALISRAAVLAAHLLKWQVQPERRSPSWMATIRIQRREIAKLLDEMPSLKPVLADGFGEIYRDGVLLAVAETNLPEQQFPSGPPSSSINCWMSSTCRSR